MIAIQLTALAASHVQSRVVVTATLPEAPPGGMAPEGAPTETWHFGVSGAVVESDAEPAHAS